MAKAVKVALPSRGKAQSVGFGLVSVAVQLKPLVEAKKPVSGSYVERSTLAKVSTKKVLPDGSDATDPVIAYPHEGSYVILPEGAIDDVIAERTGQLVLERTVDVDSIDPLYFSKTFLVYEGDGSGHVLDVLAGALRESGQAAVGTCVLAKQTQMIVLRWSSAVDCLVAHVCHFDSTVRWADVALVTAARASRPEPTEAEVAMATQLLATLEGEFDAEQVEDEFYPALLELIAATAAGTAPAEKPETKVEPAPQVDLMAQLAASVAAAKPTTKKPAAKKSAREQVTA